MKFLTKINRHYFWTLTILFALVSIIGYFVLQIILDNETKENIFEKEYAIANEIKTTGNLPNMYPLIETKKIRKSKAQPQTFKEVFLEDSVEEEEEPYLEYTHTIKIAHQYYLIKVRHSLLEKNDLILAIAVPLFLLLLLAFLVSYFTTKKLNKTLWSDFEDNLKTIENFSFKSPQALTLQNSGTEEFDRLNSTIIDLTVKLQKDYRTLKEFTENASHELQTPLTIILLNLEEMLQQNLPEQSFKQVVSSIHAVKRLAALNRSLLLLTKIENGEFHTEQVLNLNQVIQRKIEEFSPLLEKQHLKISMHTNGHFTVKIDEELADILIGNLVSNAMKHNIRNGEINIELRTNSFEICNTGKKNRLNNNTVFNRFTKENSASYGLGLSIVKQICDTHRLTIEYRQSEKHCFTILKNK